MRFVKKLFCTLPIHLIMGAISLLIYLATLKSLTHSGVVFISLLLFIINMNGYVLLSSVFLREKKFSEVIISTVLFLIIGIILWLVHLKSAFLGTLFFIYHISGYSSAMWYTYSFSNTGERLFVDLGVLYSIVPSLLILTGYSLKRLFKANTYIYLGYFTLSVFIVSLSGFNGATIETKEELANAFPMKTGFPLKFAELTYSKIDPPLPWKYDGFICCSFSIISWGNFWLSAILVFLSLLLLQKVVVWFYKKSSQRS